LRKETAATHYEAGVVAAACSEAGVEAADHSEAGDETTVCSRPRIKDIKRRQHDGVLGDRRARERESARSKNYYVWRERAWGLKF
jgi:hypothetical protein